MKIDVKKLEQSIDLMTSVGAQGKKEIKALFSNSFGIEFPKIDKVRAIHNKIYINTNEQYGLLTKDPYGWWNMYNITTSTAETTANNGRDADEWLLKNDWKETEFNTFNDWLNSKIDGEI